jgi:cytochrome c oxidase assembly protein subunit 15/protoheme IX farnesyltransferase
MKSLNRFAVFAWIVLAYNLLVILWGAYVRATGSGAGCGSHWPLCNGQVIPRAAQVETMIEFAHRLTSGFSLILVVALVIWAWRLYPKGHIVRLGAGLSLAFIITEALVGAGLVLFEWVAGNASLGRVISMAVHLVNTFLLLAALAFTAWWASGRDPLQLRTQGKVKWWFLAGYLGVMVLGVSGAVTALGDTLFPAGSLGEGIAQDFLPTAHFLVRLRVWHPVLAMMVGFYCLFLAGVSAALYPARRTKRLAIAVIALFIAQLLAGMVNLILLAPVWMQIMHLLLADLVWISLVLLGADILSVGETAPSATTSTNLSQIEPARN